MVGGCVIRKLRESHCLETFWHMVELVFSIAGEAALEPARSKPAGFIVFVNPFIYSDLRMY